MIKNSNTTPGKFILIIGPSGVGKTSLQNKLFDEHLEIISPRSATTRARREGEGDDQYVFVSEEDFDSLIKDEAFLEWAHIHGLYRSGALIQEITPYLKTGKTVVREVDVQGYDSIVAHPLFNGEDAFKLETIFIAPKSIDQLVDRIKNRAPISQEELEHRIESMKTELTYESKCDHVIVNGDGDLEKAYKELEQIVLNGSE